MGESPSTAQRANAELPPVSRAAVVSVVGSKGFLGRHICTVLTEHGHQVHEFDQDTPPTGADGLDPRVAESDHVVWAASSINPMIAENDPDRVALDTGIFLSFVTDVAALRGGPRTILLSSGGTVYDGSAVPPYSETSLVGPRTAYGRAKLELERLLLATDTAGLVLRISNAYGPGQLVAPGQGVIAHWMHAIAAGQDIHMFGDPMIARDYVHADDVAGAVAATIEQDYRTHDVVNVGAGRPTTLRALFAAIAEATGDPTLEPRLHPARSFDAASTWLDCERAASTLGWRPQIPLREGIAATWHVVAAQTLHGATPPDHAAPPTTSTPRAVPSETTS